MDVHSVIEGLSERLRATARVETVFGQPTNLEGTTVIPVASVRYAFGAGGGKGTQPGSSGEQATGEGGGAGGFVEVKPRGYLVKQGGAVTYQPIRSDTVRLGLAFGLGVLAGLIFVRGGMRSKGVGRAGKAVQ